MTVMAVISDKAHKAEVEELRKQIERNRKNYYNAVSQLESEIRTQRNVVKSLNEDNVRLRKRLSKKNETNIGNS
jgi:SMC interacting uncharacterized protein involved in chromosome segregation